MQKYEPAPQRRTIPIRRRRRLSFGSPHAVVDVARSIMDAPQRGASVAKGKVSRYSPPSAILDAMGDMERVVEPIDVQTVEVPAGAIAMRDDRIGRTWRVELQGFLIGRHPITQAQYAAVTGQQPSSYIAPQCPVESVSWIDAVRFCNMLSQAAGLDRCYDIDDEETGISLLPGRHGYRLPTEAEWEYACRAGTDGPRYGELDEIAWYGRNSGGHMHEVGRKQPNAWGLHDMLGNVWEWCADQYDPAVYGSYRVFRGGGWSDSERGCLATNRRRSHPTFAIDDLGFRVVRSPGAGRG